MLPLPLSVEPTLQLAGTWVTQPKLTFWFLRLRVFVLVVVGGVWLCHALACLKQPRWLLSFTFWAYFLAFTHVFSATVFTKTIVLRYLNDGVIDPLLDYHLTETQFAAMQQMASVSLVFLQVAAASHWLHTSSNRLQFADFIQFTVAPLLLGLEFLLNNMRVQWQPGGFLVLCLSLATAVNQLTLTYFSNNNALVAAVPFASLVATRKSRLLTQAFSCLAFPVASAVIYCLSALLKVTLKRASSAGWSLHKHRAVAIDFEDILPSGSLSTDHRWESYGAVLEM